MNLKELRQLSVSELGSRERELKDELFHLRVQKAAGQVEKSSQFRVYRREIARIKTVAREQQIKANTK